MRDKKRLTGLITLIMSFCFVANAYAVETPSAKTDYNVIQCSDNEAAYAAINGIIDACAEVEIRHEVGDNKIKAVTYYKNKYVVLDVEADEIVIEQNGNESVISKEYETILLTAGTSYVPGSLSYQTGKYDIAATFTSNITWSITTNNGGEIIDLKVRFDNIKERIVDLGSNPVYVTQMVHEVAMLDMNSINTYYSNSNTITNPTSGVEYTKTLNSSWISFIDHISNFFDLYFSNGDHISVERSSAEFN